MIIAGAGPAGSSTAFFLARAGLSVLLVDRATFPRNKPCAEYLSPEAARVLAAMDVESRIHAAGATHLTGMNVRAPNGLHIHGDFVARHGYTGFRHHGLGIRRHKLDAILVNRAAEVGTTVCERTRCVELLRRHNGRVCGVTLSLEDGSRKEIAATVVVGADGLRSTVARLSGQMRRGGHPRRLALVAHFRGISGVAEHGEMIVERDGYIGLAMVDDGLVNVALVVPHRAVAGLRGGSAEFLKSWISGRDFLADRFAQAEQVGAVLATGPFARSVRRSWRPGLALVGDAAGFFDPFTGEGMYSALRGGEMLASHLMSYCVAPANDEPLRAYEAQRREEFSGRERVERIIGRAVGSPMLMNRAAAVLSRKKDLADLLVGVTGDFVPARELLRPRHLWGLIA